MLLQNIQMLQREVVTHVGNLTSDQKREFSLKRINIVCFLVIEIYTFVVKIQGSKKLVTITQAHHPATAQRAQAQHSVRRSGLETRKHPNAGVFTAEPLGPLSMLACVRTPQRSHVVWARRRVLWGQPAPGLPGETPGVHRPSWRPYLSLNLSEPQTPHL